MKKLSLLLLAALVASTMVFTGCGDDDEPATTPAAPQGTIDPFTGDPLVYVTSNVAADRTWSNDSVYILTTRVTVLSGATLTIEPGTLIKAEGGTGANATALLVARGGMLMADGTAAAPIIFTSVLSKMSLAQIANGDFKDPELDAEINGLWGGVIVLGNAAISASASPVQIDGIPTSDTNGLYGGSNDTENSGVLRYISIRHGGSNIGAGNEINGLTLGGVGSGTTIENIEVVGNADDGIEWFGGTVSLTNAVVWNAGDDGLDTDQGWSGTCKNFIVVTAGGHNFELDGPEGTTLTDVQHTFENGTVVHATFDTDGDVIRSAADIINTDANSGVILKNIFITGIPAGEGNIINRVNAANVTFDGVVLDVVADSLANYLPAGATLPVAGISAGSTGTKADASVFGWTWAGQSGGLAGL